GWAGRPNPTQKTSPRERAACDGRLRARGLACQRARKWSFARCAGRTGTTRVRRPGSTKAWFWRRGRRTGGASCNEASERERERGREREGGGAGALPAAAGAAGVPVVIVARALLRGDAHPLLRAHLSYEAEEQPKGKMSAEGGFGSLEFSISVWTLALVLFL